MKSRLMIAALLFGPLAWLLLPTLIRAEAFAFRDAAHYYYPLYRYTSGAWSAGQIPLWNPLDQLGTPLAADATAAVFYPGQLILALPIGYGNAYKLYIVLHLLLAGATSWGLARRWQASPTGAALAALAYMLSGAVLFQHCNVVFLVGAAWLPAALLCADHLLTERRARWAVALGAVLALMTLGGDPQAGYHAGLIAALQALLLWRNDRRLRRPLAQRQIAAAQQRGLLAAEDEEVLAIAEPGRRGAGLLAIFRHRLVLLSLAALAGLSLSAVQVLPSLEWSRRSERASYAQPRSLWELTDARPKDSPPLNADGLLVRNSDGTHLNHAYQFSVGPWHAAELIWPNFSGAEFPEHRRWINALPAEGRVWVPSLYLGLLPALLGITAWRVRQGTIPVRLMSWTFLWFALGSCGWYGLGWLVDELLLATAGIQPGSMPVGPPVGGLYWLMTVALPGYVYFRYPAKLLAPASLALCMLAAAGWDRMHAGEYRRLRNLLAGVVVLSAAGLLVLALSGVSWQHWLRHIPANALFGPFDADGARRDLAFSFAHAALLAAVCWLLIPRVATSGSTPGHLAFGSNLWAWVLLGVTSVDLAVAQRPLLPTTPQVALDQRSELDGTDQLANQATGGPPARLYRAGGHRLLPAEWATTRSPERLRQGVAWDRGTLLPRYHLLEQQAIINGPTTITAADYERLLDLAETHGPQHSPRTPLPHRAILNALGVTRLVLPDDAPYDDLLRLPATSLPAGPAAAYENPQAYPRAWTVREVVSLPRRSSASPAAREARLREIYFPGNSPRDLRRVAVVEENRQTAWPGSRSTPASRPAEPLPASESCVIARYEPRRVEIDVALREPALLVLSDLYTPDWQAEISAAGSEPQPAPLLRANGVMRGVRLAAGTQRVTFHYRPRSHQLGARISLLCWFAALLVLAPLMTFAALDARRASRAASPTHESLE